MMMWLRAGLYFAVWLPFAVTGASGVAVYLLSIVVVEGIEWVIDHVREFE